ncbi:MAG: serine hydrolase domain-containing protein [Gemmatimonadota bacterium]
MRLVRGPAFWCALSAFLLAPSSASAQFDAVKASIQRKLTEDGVPSLAVAVARNGKIVWEAAYGWADREKRIPATEHTMYSLASISKPITATGLMVLVERGQVDLDRPVNDYLGTAKLNGHAFDASKATVRLVAAHRAGLPLHYQFFYEDEPFKRPAMDETIRRYGNLVTPPGERYQYSNLGFGIIDYVVSRVSGTSYPEFMRREVFMPLGLTHTSVDIGPGLEAFAATRYAADGTPIPFYDFDHPGASAVFSSAHDLVRFGMFHLKDKLPEQKAILTAASIDAMHVAVGSTGARSGYGIGWEHTVNEKGLEILSHDGGMGGVSTTLTLLPQLDAVVVVLANSSSGAPSAISEEIVAVLAPDRTAAPAKAAAPAATLSAAERKRYLGDYDVGDMQVSVSEDGGRLMVTVPQGSSLLLYRGNDRFDVAAAPGASLSFTWEGTTPVLALQMEGPPKTGRRHPPGPAFRKIPELAGTWAGAVETYEGPREVTLRVDEAGPIYLRLGSAPWTLLDAPSYSDGTLSGQFAGDIGTGDANRRPYRLRLEVKLRGNVLNGGLTAQTVPANRIGNGLTYWIELKRM